MEACFPALEEGEITGKGLGESGKMELHPEPTVKLKSIKDKREIVWARMAREESQGRLHGGFHSSGTERERQ